MTARSLRSTALYRRLAADVGTLELATGPAWPGPVTEAQLDGLPDAAQHYLRFMGAVGRPADWSFLAHVTGKFRMRPGLPWMRCQAWQYNSGPSVARLFHMRIVAAGVLPMTGRDAYVGGHGRLLATLAGRVTVADSAGPETDLSELVTYLQRRGVLGSVDAACPRGAVGAGGRSLFRGHPRRQWPSGHRPGVPRRARRPGQLQHRGSLG